MTSKVFAPKLVKKLHKAALKYEKWKVKSKNPNYKPWIYPEQIHVQRIDWNDIIAVDLNQMKVDSVDESQINENDVDKSETNNDVDDTE